MSLYTNKMEEISLRELNDLLREKSIYKTKEKYFPLGSEVTLMVPDKEDLEKDEKIVTYAKLLDKAKSPGLTQEEIDLLKKGKGWIN